MVLRDAAEIVQVLLGRVLAEIGARDLVRTEIRNHLLDGLEPVVHHAEAAAGIGAVSPALFLRRALKHEHFGTLLAGRNPGTKRGVAAADDDHVVEVFSHGYSHFV